MSSSTKGLPRVGDESFPIACGGSRRAEDTPQNLAPITRRNCVYIRLIPSILRRCTAVVLLRSFRVWMTRAGGVVFVCFVRIAAK